MRPNDLEPSDKLLVALHCDAEGYSFNAGLGTQRSARLAWLEDMQRAPERVSAGAGDELVFALAENVRLFVSGENGFPTRLEKQTEKGTRVGAELVSLETQKPPEEAQFELPEPGEAARDGSDEFELSVRARAFLSSRASLFGCLARAIDDERLVWSDELHSKIGALVEGLREVDFTPFSARLARHRLAWVEQAAGQYAEKLAQLDLSDPQVKAGVAAQLAGNRSSLEKSMGAELEREMAREFARAPCKRRPSLRDELLEIEKRVLPAIHARECSQPVLAAFDEKIGKLVETK